MHFQFCFVHHLFITPFYWGKGGKVQKIPSLLEGRHGYVGTKDHSRLPSIDNTLKNAFGTYFWKFRYQLLNCKPHCTVGNKRKYRIICVVYRRTANLPLVRCVKFIQDDRKLRNLGGGCGVFLDRISPWNLRHIRCVHTLIKKLFI